VIGKIIIKRFLKYFGRKYRHREKYWEHFKVSFGFITMNLSNEEIVCWDDDQNLKHNDSGSRFCQGIFSSQLDSHYRFDDEGDNQDLGDNSGSDNSDPSDPTIYTQDEDSDLHIKDFHLAVYGTDDWEHRVEKQLYPGQSFQIEGEVRIENDSGVDAGDIDSDYRVDHGKNFDTDDTKIDEDNLFDLDLYETITKSIGRTTISLSEDGLTVTVQGPGRSESFQVENGFCKIYFFVDIENDDDDDISSNSDSDEYGVVEITVIPFTPKFTASSNNIIGSATIDFTDLTEGYIRDWIWNFGDGETSNEMNPSHYYDIGTYKAIMSVSNGEFSVSISQIITIIQLNPSITIISPRAGEKWRSSKDRTIRWTWANLPYGEAIKVEYSCDNGVHWKTIYDGYTTNDGKKKWKMDKSKTKDTSYGYIRVLRRSDGLNLGRSPRFKIDHASGNPKW